MQSAWIDRDADAAVARYVTPDEFEALVLVRP